MVIKFDLRKFSQNVNFQFECTCVKTNLIFFILAINKLKVINLNTVESFSTTSLKKSKTSAS